MRKPDQRRTASWGQAACASGSSPLQNMFRVDDQIKGVREGVEVCGGLGWDLSLESWVMQYWLYIVEEREQLFFLIFLFPLSFSLNLFYSFLSQE